MLDRREVSWPDKITPEFSPRDLMTLAYFTVYAMEDDHDESQYSLKDVLTFRSAGSQDG